MEQHELSQPATVNVFTDNTAKCLCVTNHNPNVVVFHQHHIIPLYKGGKDIPNNIVLLCPNAHASVHNLISHYEKGRRDWNTVRKFNPYIRELAWKAML